VGILNNTIIPTIFTVTLHAMVLAAVLVGWQLNDVERYHVEVPRHVKAELVTIEQPKARQLLERKPRVVPKAAPPPAQPPKEAPPTRRVQPAAAEPIAVPDRSRKTAAIKPESEPPTSTEPRPRPRPQAPAADAAASAAAASTQRKQAQRAALAEAMAEEELELQAEQDELVADNYASLIKERVESTWSRPPSARKNMQVVLSIRLIPTGEVVGVEVVKSSGNLAFDRSAIVAVEKAQRFPELQDLSGPLFESYFRRFTLVFKPEDLLL
jgi:colicin import membrane protein